MQSHGAYFAAFAAANAALFGLFVSQTVGQQQNSGSQLGYGGIDVKRRRSHHRAAKNYLSDVGCYSAGLFNQERRRCPYPDPVVGRMKTGISADGYDAFKQRFVFHYRLIDGKDGSDILNQTAGVGRKFSRRNFSSGNGGNQLFFAALRIFGRANLDVYADIGLGYFGEYFNCPGFVFVNGNNGVLNAQCFVDDFCSDDDLFRLFNHQAVVRSQERFTFDAVDNQAIDFFAFGQFRLDGRGITGAAHADDAGFANFCHDFFRRKRNFPVNFG